jgi:hypothetical protein
METISTPSVSCSTRRAWTTQSTGQAPCRHQRRRRARSTASGLQRCPREEHGQPEARLRWVSCGRALETAPWPPAPCCRSRDCESRFFAGMLGGDPDPHAARPRHPRRGADHVLRWRCHRRSTAWHLLRAVVRPVGTPLAREARTTYPCVGSAPVRGRWPRAEHLVAAAAFGSNGVACRGKATSSRCGWQALGWVAEYRAGGAGSIE